MDLAMHRYSSRAFPPYAFLPGRDPHPRRDPKGYAYGQRETPPPAVTAENWTTHDDYRHGIDLYNHGYWWACHEALEALWHVAGHATAIGQLLQGIIQVAAGNLKRSINVDEGAQRLWSEALGRLAALPGPLLGVDVRSFERDVRDFAARRRETPPVITLGGYP